MITGKGPWSIRNAPIESPTFMCHFLHFLQTFVLFLLLSNIRLTFFQTKVTTSFISSKSQQSTASVIYFALVSSCLRHVYLVRCCQRGPFGHLPQTSANWAHTLFLRFHTTINQVCTKLGRQARLMPTNTWPAAALHAMTTWLVQVPRNLASNEHSSALGGGTLCLVFHSVAFESLTLPVLVWLLFVLLVPLLELKILPCCHPCLAFVWFSDSLQPIYTLHPLSTLTYIHLCKKSRCRTSLLHDSTR